MTGVGARASFESRVRGEPIPCLFNERIESLFSSFIRAGDKGSKPPRQLLLRHHSGSYRQHRFYYCLVGRTHCPSVQIEERFSDDVSRTFVAVEKAVIIA